MRKILFLFVFFGFFWVFASNSAQVTDVVNSSRIYQTPFLLYAGHQYEFRTESQSDTVLHLLSSSYSQVAYNDDCGNSCNGAQGALNSTIIFTPSYTGYFYLMMHHYQSGVVGAVATIREYDNGFLIQSRYNTPVGGYKIAIDSWDAYSNSYGFRYLDFYYQNMSKKDAGGAASPDTVMYLLSHYTTVTDFDDDGGASYSSKIRKTGGSCSYGCKVLGGGYPIFSDSEGNARLLVDVQSLFGDLDFDGLSGALETILGTSSSSKDSDGDGLNDYLEAVGSGNVALPWEGSSPTVQDVFVEVDYFGRIDDQGISRKFYKDYEANIESELTDSFDRHGNIRLHLDVDDYLGTMKDQSTLVFAHCNTGNDSHGFYLEDERSTHFTMSRDGMYRWLVAANRHTSSGTNSSGVACGATYNGSNRLIVSLGRKSGGGTLEQYIGTTIHELGHNFGLGHNGNDNRDPSKDSLIHRSVMNYRYQMVGATPHDPTDNIWRYATDDPNNSPGLDWNSFPGKGCLDPSASPKPSCIGQTAPSDCDCTFNEWDQLDLTSHGVMGAGVDLGEKSLSTEHPEENPVFGFDGAIIAENLEDLRNSGALFTKTTTERAKAKRVDKMQRLNKKFYTDDVKKAYFKQYIQRLLDKGLKEGEDFRIIDGKVFFDKVEK